MTDVLALTVQSLTARRREIGMSQRRLAALVGTSQSAISEIETGVVTPSVGTLERWTRALGGHFVMGFQVRDDDARRWVHWDL